MIIFCSVSHQYIRCIAAHSMIIQPNAAVKLSTIKLGPSKNIGFAIHARRLIRKGEAIPELIGMMPMDNDTPHTNLSSIQPHFSQNQDHRSERVLFGPIRFINHLCINFNAEVSFPFFLISRLNVFFQYVAVYDQSAFIAYAIRDILAGEEITVDYGLGFFEDKGGCPCITCKPVELPEEHSTSQSGSHGKRPTVEVEVEVAEKKRSKRRRRDANARLNKKAN